MLRRKAEPINDVLHAFLRMEGLETPLNEMRAAEAWERVAPESARRFTRGVEVRGGVMYVSVSNPSLRANMMMARASLVQRINDAVGAQAITSIVFK